MHLQLAEKRSSQALVGHLQLIGCAEVTCAACSADKLFFVLVPVDLRVAGDQSSTSWWTHGETSRHPLSLSASVGRRDPVSHVRCFCLWCSAHASCKRPVICGRSVLNVAAFPVLTFVSRWFYCFQQQPTCGGCWFLLSCATSQAFYCCGAAGAEEAGSPADPCMALQVSRCSDQMYANSCWQLKSQSEPTLSS